MPSVTKKQSFDKRYFPRWQVENRILFKPEENHDFDECSTRDISCSGASFYTKESCKIGQVLDLVIFFNNYKTLDVKGTVVWRKSLSEDYIIGITFKNLTRREQALILKYAFEIRKKEVSDHWFKGWDNKDQDEP